MASEKLPSLGRKTDAEGALAEVSDQKYCTQLEMEEDREAEESS